MSLGGHSYAVISGLLLLFQQRIYFWALPSGKVTTVAEVLVLTGIYML